MWPDRYSSHQACSEPQSREPLIEPHPVGAAWQRVEDLQGGTGDHGDGLAWRASRKVRGGLAGECSMHAAISAKRPRAASSLAEADISRA